MGNSVEHLTLDLSSGVSLRIMSSSPELGSTLGVEPMEGRKERKEKGRRKEGKKGRKEASKQAFHLLHISSSVSRVEKYSMPILYTSSWQNSQQVIRRAASFKRLHLSGKL